MSLNRRYLPLAFAVIALTGCQHTMRTQPRYDPLEESTFFPDGQSARPLVRGTIARGQFPADSPFATGRSEGDLIDELPEDPRTPGEPMQLTTALLDRGRQRFNIYCAACHDRTGSGHGMVVQRGFPAPPSFHAGDDGQRLRAAPLGHFFDVITRGFGRMPSHAGQVSPRDRWAIAAYIRALQLSQHAPKEYLNDEDLRRINAP